MRGPAFMLALLLLAPQPAAAVVVSGEDPGASRRAPAEDPGWGHVGRLGTVSAVYLGDGWVVTAGHAGMGDLELGDTKYPAVQGSRVVLDAPGPSRAPSDLALFRVEPAPPLPRLELSRETPTRGTSTVLVGYGFGRGEPLDGAGYRWEQQKHKRWGTNRVSRSGLDLPGPRKSLTHCFIMDFSRHGTAHEAQAAPGDSGGAVFARMNGSWRLAGIMISMSTDPTQEPRTALFSNTTTAADLSAYRQQIRRVLRGKSGQ